MAMPHLLKAGMISGIVAVAAAAHGGASAADSNPQPAEAPQVVSYHHASTAAEGWLRGRADLVRAWGQAYYNVMAGKVLREDARNQYIENRKRATEVYFERKQINADYREAQRRKPLSTEQLADIAERNLPGRLSASELDRRTGAVNWPTLLEDQRFDETRAALESLLAARSVENDNSANVRRAAAQMKVALKRMARESDPYNYIAARKFVDRLAYESRYAPVQVVPGLAVNR